MAQALELEHETSPGAARLEDAMCLSGQLGRDDSSDSEGHLALLHLLTETVELGLLSGIAANEHRMKRDAPFLLPLEAAKGGDSTAIAYRSDDQFVQQRGIDKPVNP